MTQDQRNSFVKLVERVREEFRSRRAQPYEDCKALEAERKKRFGSKFRVVELRKRFEQARETMRVAEAKYEEAKDKVDSEVRKLERADSAASDRLLDVFTVAAAEVLALDDAKEAQKVIERLAKL